MKNKLAFLKSSATAVGLLLSTFSLPWQSLDATWQPAEVISNPAQPIQFSRVESVLSVNTQGNAVGVWVDSGNPVFGEGFETITSNFYNRGIGWQGPVIISSLALNSNGENLYDAQGDPDVAMNSSNYAVAVWEGSYLDGDFPQVIIATVRQSNGIWGPVQVISGFNPLIFPINCNVALNEAGTAVAAWRDTNYTTFKDHTVVSILPFGGSWSTPLIISNEETAIGDSNNKPCVVINEAGDIGVVWWARTPDGFAIVAATYDAGTATWSSPVTLDTGFDLDHDPRCAIDENGNVVAVWSSSDTIKTAFFTPGTGWGPSEVIASGLPGSINLYPIVVMDPAGNATATWPADDQIYAASKPINGGWTTPVVISSGTGNYQIPFMSQEPLAVDADGNVMAVWYSVDSGITYSSYRLFNQPWQAPEIVFPDSINNLSVGLAACGFAVALSDGDEVVAAVNENFLAPFGARYTRCTQKFASQTVSLDRLAWSPLPAECILFYNIYCNGALVGVVPGNGPYEFIYNTCRNCNYTLTSINFWGFESAPVPFTLQ